MDYKRQNPTKMELDTESPHLSPNVQTWDEPLPFDIEIPHNFSFQFS